MFFYCNSLNLKGDRFTATTSVVLLNLPPSGGKEVQRIAAYFIASSTATAQEDDGNSVHENVAHPEIRLIVPFVKALFVLYINGTTLSSFVFFAQESVKSVFPF